MLSLVLVLAQVWGVRTLPEGEDGWRVRWQGEGPVALDGHPVEARGALDLRADRAHEVTIGGLRFEVPAKPADPCAPLRFVVLGDGRAAVGGVGPSAYWAPMLDEAIARRPAFLVNTGDLVKNGRVAAEWDHYLRTLPPWPPVLAVRGNHDRGPHFEALGLGVPIWSWTAGPAFLVGLDSEVSEEAFAGLVAELDRRLAASDALWKIVFLHRPIWSRGNHGSDERGFNALLVPVFDRHRVALVFSGHDHNYERFCPLHGLADRRCTEDGTTYVVTGGAATFTNPIPGVSRKVSAENAAIDDQTSRAYSGAHHFVQIDITRGTLTAEAHATRAGNVRPPGRFDRFVLTRRDLDRCRYRRDAGVE